MDTLEISNGGLHGVASTETCLVKRLQTPFAFSGRATKSGFKSQT